jgi:hypothetical protein
MLVLTAWDREHQASVSGQIGFDGSAANSTDGNALQQVETANKLPILPIAQPLLESVIQLGPRAPCLAAIPLAGRCM